VIPTRNENVVLNASRDIQPNMIVRQQDLRLRSPTRSTQRLKLAPNSAVLAKRPVNADRIIGERNPQPGGLGSLTRRDKAEPYNEEPE
jgi:hypothetical protein